VRTVGKRGVYALAAGGTGGHLFPAVSLAKQLKAAGCVVHLYTDERTKEWLKVEWFDEIFVFHLKRKSGRLIFISRLLLCGLKCLFSFIRNRPKIVIGFGGYQSAPPLFAAQLLRIKTIIHESNAILGRANAILAKFASCVATGVPEVVGLPKRKLVFVGNPVRAEIQELYDVPYTVPPLDGTFHILVIGGSQGAGIFSEVVPAAIKTMPKTEQKRIEVRQQTRMELMKATERSFRDAGVAGVQLTHFFDDMRAALDWAHLVISRGGAMSLAEFLVAGKPAIIVPLKASIDNDQALNSEYFARRMACVTIAEDDLSPEVLGHTITRLMNSTDELVRMSNAAKSLASPDADRLFMEKIKEVLAENA
jgi:UDP-N-acetylglucosamine--N-acetylmuramyl-(pentapeptide) pyrophosphoryl-undecaprenol N-acetylglucosamine transferase